MLRKISLFRGRFFGETGFYIGMLFENMQLRVISCSCDLKKNTFQSKNLKSNTQALLSMAIVRIGKGSFCRMERPRAFEILKADSSYYKVVGTFDVTQRSLLKLMAIYRDKMFCQIRAAKKKTTQIYS